MTGHLDFFPDWRRGNPFLSMLFSRLDQVGLTARPTGPLLDHLALAASSDQPGILNVHWTAPLLARAPDETRAQERVELLAARLEAFTAAGGRLVWTVHNVLPHDAPHREQQVAVCRLLADHADVVHVLSAETTAAVAPHYSLDPAKVVTIPHSSYTGIYADRISRRRARRRLELDADDQALLALGRIRPYKGLDRLLDAFGRPPLTAPRLRLLVAGLQGHGAGMPELAERLATTPRVLSRTRRVPDRSLQVWMHASDLAVLPYTDILNSGAFLLAETFGLPVVAPRTGALVSRESATHVRLFDPGDPDDLARVLVRAISELVVDTRGAEAARESALSTARANPPALMAQRFADVVAALTRPSA